jgi:cyclopropane fatty-acyl-phospholipid synthase-like methyltransferase
LPEEQGVPGSGSSSYEVVPYAGWSFEETHPDRLATIATLFGMKPPEVARARVLEIGCGLGANLIPMAAGLPEGSFLGIDVSERQVAEGRATIEAAGLTNVALTRMNLMDAGPDLGTFDYIVCHGVYSWVGPEVQQKILATIAAHLAPDGVA